MHQLILFLFLCFSTAAYSSENRGFERRKEWVKLLREFALEMEESNKDKILTYEERSFLQKFELISSAWADSRYDCLYAGWPSVLKSVGGRKLCTNPAVGNAGYDKSSCKSNELQCQPLLFGKGLCVSFGSKQEKQTSFSRCDKKFKSEKRNEDFLKTPEFTSENANELRELSALAATICDPDGAAPQRKTPMCQKIMKRLPLAMASIDEAWRESTIREESQKQTKQSSQVGPSVVKESKEDLSCLTENSVKETVTQVQRVTEAALTTPDDIYEVMKAEFEKSPFCDPAKIVSDPAEKGNAFLVKAAVKSLQFFSEWQPNKSARMKKALFQSMASGYDLSEETVSKIESYIDEMESMTQFTEKFRELGYKARALALKEIINKSKADPSYQKERVEAELVASNIFTEDDEGNIKCPFVGKDAFLKALAGQEEILKKLPGSVKNKDQITIVDYTRPSNERRMFVIDLKTNKVLHNTWVAHGMGGNSTAGNDNKGSLSSANMSNISGSNKSSDGFIIAQAKSYGSLYGDNVLLKGVDINNTNLASRAVVLHGWQSPLASYQEGLVKYSYDEKSSNKTIDTVHNFLSLDLSVASPKEIENAFSDLSNSVSLPPFLAPTEGCLGVPVTQVKHLDSKGRSETQLELLRQDLPGSVIFNYSGPDMKSKFL